MKIFVGVALIFIFFLIFCLIILSCCSASTAKLAPKQNLTRSVNHDIDLVVTWVDGDDPERNALRQSYKNQTTNLNSHDVGACRYTSHDELFYLLLSVEKYAPWIRTIWILASGTQHPSWLKRDHPRVRVVYDHDIFDNPEWIPTFNSHALECHLHKIPGLSEVFLYANDDMFFGNVCHPEYFLHEDGKVKLHRSIVIQCHSGPINDLDDAHKNAWRNNQRLLDTKSKEVPRMYPLHQITAMTKTMMSRAEENFNLDWTNTSSRRFRTKHDIHPVGLAQYFGVYEQRASWVFSFNTYVSLTDSVWVNNNLMFGAVIVAKRTLFCINDQTNNPTGEVTKNLRLFLKKYMQIDGKDPIYDWMEPL